MNFRDAMNIVDYKVYDEEIKHDEIVDFIRKNNLNKTPVILNVEGKRVATNFLSTRELLCKYLRIEVKELARYLSQIGYSDKIVIEEGEYVELRSLKDLPIPRYFKRDAGRYITSGIIVTGEGKDFSKYNASFHRMLLLDDSKLAARLVPPRHTFLRWRESVDKGEDLEIAVVIAPHPLFMLAAATRVEWGMEFRYAASLMGKLKVIEFDGIYCPESEIVMRGRITAEMVDEGPFVDITGTYDRVRKAPVIEIDKIYAKENFIFYSITPSGYEHQILMGIPFEPEIYKAVAKVCKVKNVVMSPGGKHYLHAIIQIESVTEGDGKNAILAAFAAHPSLKHVVVVDEDINIYDPEDVEYAIATRFQADRDLVIVTNVRGSSLDPSARDNITAKMGIDATVKGEREKYHRV